MYNALLINAYKSTKLAKETNWKYNFLNSQNANICLTSLNVENNGNLYILSFCCVP